MALKEFIPHSIATNTISLFVLFLLTTCTQKQSDEKIFGDFLYRIELKGKENNVVKKIDSLFDSLRFISLKTTPDIAIASISKIRIFQGKIFVLDKKFSSLTCFDEDGNFIMKYGKIGLAENEYLAIQDFDIDSLKKEIIILSNENRSLYYYSLNTGDFIRKKKVSFFASSFSILQNSKLIFYVDYKIDSDVMDETNIQGYNILILDSNFQTVKKYLPFRSRKSIGWSSMTGFLTNSNNKILFSDAFNDTIFLYTDYISLFSSINITSDSIQEKKMEPERVLSSGILLDSATSFLRNHFFQNENYLIFNYQSEKRIKNAIYKQRVNSLRILSTKDVADPLLVLTWNIVDLSEDDVVTFSILLGDIFNVKQKQPYLYNKMDDTIRNKFDISDSTSSPILLRGHLKH